jgi:hypothetical protein
MQPAHEFSANFYRWRSLMGKTFFRTGKSERDLLDRFEISRVKSEELFFHSIKIHVMARRAQRLISSANHHPNMHPDIANYNQNLPATDRVIVDLQATVIDKHLPVAENKIWHAHPVWFLDGKPVVGYSKLKDSVRLLFWSGQSFEEPGLRPEGKFKAAEPRYSRQNR